MAPFVRRPRLARDNAGVLRAGLRRFVVLVGVTAGAIALFSIVIGAALHASVNRSLAVGYEAFGCALLVFGFFVGNRGPVRTKGDAVPFYGPRFLRWATQEEHRSTIAESAIFIVLGVLLIFLGVVIDKRYSII